MRWHWVLLSLCAMLILWMARVILRGDAHVPNGGAEAPPTIGLLPAQQSPAPPDPSRRVASQPGSAAESPRPASARVNAAENALGEILDRDPYNVGALRAAYAAARDAGDVAVQWEAARRILVMDPDDLDFAFEAVAELGRHDQWRAAAALLDSLRPRHDDSAAFWLNLATAARAAGRYSQALEAFSQAARCDPQDAAAPAGRGAILVQLLDWAAAVDELQRAVELAPTAVEPALNLAEAHLYLGEFAAAESVLTTVQTANPRDVRIWNARGETAWREFLQTNDDAARRRAAQSWTRSLEIAPGQPEIRRRAALNRLPAATAPDPAPSSR